MVSYGLFVVRRVKLEFGFYLFTATLNRLGLGPDGKPLPEEPVMTDMAVEDSWQQPGPGPSVADESGLGNLAGGGDVPRAEGGGGFGVGVGVEHMEQDAVGGDHFTGQPAVVAVDLNKLLSASSVQNSGTAAWLGLAPADQGSPPELFPSGDKSEDSSITSDRFTSFLDHKCQELKIVVFWRLRVA
jgi:hypothetical protein